jgi:hypothetical protein
MRADYQYLLILEFDDIEGLRAYLEHPAHDAIGGFFTSAASASLAYDYEVVDLREAKKLLNSRGGRNAGQIAGPSGEM